MCVVGQDDVNVVDYGCYFFVDVKFIVVQNDDVFGVFCVYFVDYCLYVFIVDFECIFGEYLVRIGDWYVGEGLVDDCDFGVVMFKYFVGWKEFCWFVLFYIKNVLFQCCEWEILDDFGYLVVVQCEFLVECYGIWVQCVYDIDYVLISCFVIGVGIMLGVVVVQQDCIRMICVNGFDDGCYVVQFINLVIFFGQ